jgi:hypothetical protein
MGGVSYCYTCQFVSSLQFTPHDCHGRRQLYCVVQSLMGAFGTVAASYLEGGSP